MNNRTEKMYSELDDIEVTYKIQNQSFERFIKKLKSPWITDDKELTQLQRDAYDGLTHHNHCFYISDTDRSMTQFDFLFLSLCLYRSLTIERLDIAVVSDGSGLFKNSRMNFCGQMYDASRMIRKPSLDSWSVSDRMRFGNGSQINFLWDCDVSSKLRGNSIDMLVLRNFANYKSPFQVLKE